MKAYLEQIKKDAKAAKSYDDFQATGKAENFETGVDTSTSTAQTTSSAQLEKVENIKGEFDTAKENKEYHEIPEGTKPEGKPEKN